MGGDHAPDEIVRGAVEAAREGSLNIVLVGDQSRIHPFLPGDFQSLGVEVRHASECIAMHESPVFAIRRKRDSSLAVCMRMLKEKTVDGVVSAGNTGAATALAQMIVKRIEGIDRSAIATVLPTAKDNVVLIDSGANVECRPQNLLEFALMGTVYSRYVLGKENPVVGLLSIGAESVKGNELTRAAYELLSEAPINFHGNVEGRDIGMGLVDIVVCDGFVGNVVLKVAEGYGLAILKMLKESLMGSDPLTKLGMLFMRGSFRKFKKRVDYAECGGAPLLGVNGVCIIAHGSSNAYAMKNAIRIARLAIEDRVIDHIRESLPSLPSCVAGAVSVGEPADVARVAAG